MLLKNNCHLSWQPYIAYEILIYVKLQSLFFNLSFVYPYATLAEGISKE